MWNSELRCMKTEKLNPKLLYTMKSSQQDIFFHMLYSLNY